MKNTISCINSNGDQFEVPLETVKREYITVLGLQDDFKEPDKFVVSLCSQGLDLGHDKAILMMSYAHHRDMCFVIDIFQNFENIDLIRSCVKGFSENQSFTQNGMDMMREVESYIQACMSNSKWSRNRYLSEHMKNHKQSAMRAYTKLKEVKI